MRAALALARRGAGQVSPNPLVGAVIVRKGEIVGRGFHVYANRDHAEIVALAEAGKRARGATLYVTLEPCAHQGRTPPCADRVIEAGIARVVAAARDPNPRVSGRGFARLREGGVQVEEGVAREEAEVLNEAYLHRVRTGRPFILLKLAMTLDGRLADRAGLSQWITGTRARSEVHRLRYESDAILIGSRTLRQDDPSLTVRYRRQKQILRVVLDSSLSTPPGARLFQSTDPVLLFHGPSAPKTKARQLSRKAELVPVSRQENGLAWAEVLDQLGRRAIGSVLIEGGAAVAASALRAGIVDKLCLFYAPKILGSEGLAAIGKLGIGSLPEALKLKNCRMRRLGSDFLIEGYPGRVGRLEG